MKNALFLVLGICTVMVSAQAQNGNGNYVPRDNNYGYGQRDDKWIDSDALENMAFQRLDNALNGLVREAGGLIYTPPTRGGQRIDLAATITSMSNEVANLKRLTKGRREERNKPYIQSSFKSLDISANALINAIPGLSRGSANLIDNILAITKAVGAVDLALDAPRSAGPYVPPVIEPKPPVTIPNVKANYCYYSFSNGYGSTYTLFSEGFNDSETSIGIYNACSSISGSSGYSNTSNAQLCQSNLSKPNAPVKCANSIAYTASQDAYQNRFTTCTFSMSNGYGSSYPLNSAGASYLEAVTKIVDSCKTISGSSGYSNLSNADLCRKTFIEYLQSNSKNLSCIVR